MIKVYNQSQRYIDIVSTSRVSASGCVSYQEMVNYCNSVASGITASGGVSYEQMVDYVDASIQAIPTCSGVTYEEMEWYFNTVSSGITCSGCVTYDAMVAYVADHCTTSGTTVSGVTYEQMMFYVDNAINTYSGEAYQQMVNYVDYTLTTYSGNAYWDMVDYVNYHCTTASGYVTYDDMVNYVDTVVSGITISGGGANTEYVDSKIRDLCEHFHLDITTTSGDLHRHIEFIAFANQEFDGPTFTPGETWDYQWDGGELVRETTTSGNCQ
jgi:hypothetical protein